MLKVRKVKVQLLHVAAEKFKFRNSLSLHNTVLVVHREWERWEGGRGFCFLRGTKGAD